MEMQGFEPTNLLQNMSLLRSIFYIRQNLSVKNASLGGIWTLNYQVLMLNMWPLNIFEVAF